MSNEIIKYITLILSFLFMNYFFIKLFMNLKGSKYRWACGGVFFLIDVGYCIFFIHLI